MQKFLHYFIDPNTPTTSLGVSLGLSLSLLLIISGILLPVVIKQRQRRSKPSYWWEVWRAWAGVFRIAGLIWLVLFFLRYQSLVPFTFRFWIYLPFLPVVIWLFLLYRSKRALRPVLQKQSLLADHYEKYLPKSKKTRA